MKKIIPFLVVILLIAESLSAQVAGKFWIVFTDKNNSPYSISNPSAYLSSRCLARRAKYGIPILYNDLPPNPSYIDSVISKGVKLLNRSKWFNAISIYTTDTTKMAAIRALPFVQNSKYVTRVKPHSKDPSFFTETVEPLNWPHNTTNTDSLNYGSSYNQLHMIHVDCLNNMGFRGKGIQIAQIDARFGEANQLPAFDTLYNRGQVLGTWDFVWGITNVYDDTNNVDVHGEECLSCMAGNLPTQLLGDAMDANYYLLRAEDAPTENMIEDDNWASAAEYADSAGADVITTSLYYTTFDDANTNYKYADMNGRTAVASIAATICAEKGMVVCACAGNLGNNVWHYVGSPDDADSILTVGAVDASGNYASFSSTGPTYDRRVKPDVAAQGVNAAVASPSGGVGGASGTSFSTPIIAGAVASLWQANPNMTNMQIIQAIKQSANQYFSPDSLRGYGIPNFCNANSILTGMNGKQGQSSISEVYPNPFQSSISLGFFSTIQQNVEIKLYNSIGQVVYENKKKVAGNGNTLISLNGLISLPQGLYLVTIKEESGKVFTSKVVK